MSCANSYVVDKAESGRGVFATMVSWWTDRDKGARRRSAGDDSIYGFVQGADSALHRIQRPWGNWRTRGSVCDCGHRTARLTIEVSLR